MTHPIIALFKIFDSYQYILLKTALGRFRSTGPDAAEIEFEDMITMSTWSGVGSNIVLPKKGIKLFLVLQAIVIAEHGHKQRLAKTPGTQKKMKGAGSFSNCSI